MNPWFFSPMVITAQLDILIRNNGLPPFTLSLGGQGFLNQVRSPAGSWSGQAFIQYGPKLALGEVGPFSLLNPFVQLFVAMNQGQPAGAGMPLGNQAMWAILRDKNDEGQYEDKLSFILNTQVLNTVGLDNGKVTGPPAGQVLFGFSYSF
jgi:hypothetical protein